MRQIKGAQRFGSAVLRRGRRIVAITAGFAAAFFAVFPAHAQESAWAGIDEAQVREQSRSHLYRISHSGKLLNLLLQLRQMFSFLKNKTILCVVEECIQLNPK